MGVVMERWCPTQQMLGVFLRGSGNEENVTCVCYRHCWIVDCLYIWCETSSGAITRHLFYVSRALQRLQLCELPISCHVEAHWRVRISASSQWKLEPCFSKACATSCTEMHSSNDTLGRMSLKTTILTGVAALFLATGMAHATGPDDCAVVVQTRDGFLNVREAPTMKSKIIAKLHPMDMV